MRHYFICKRVVQLQLLLVLLVNSAGSAHKCTGDNVKYFLAAFGQDQVGTLTLSQCSDVHQPVF